ncbi:cell division protein FtsZ [Candidatus Roizmanbacteria bacterium RIFCSPLOWO2_12_FULL_40_12]|uniref:Cell division protein FtsZ n=1 Tax=Candidatus Roizmanbacteria bacterium RIFCSPLOWO2_01_FULL_40_42 TaxID=1802066 RepID=A0A1F7J4U6_9BACT|nr:MAG: cell division protein FtsZ [Candidatus Roizmanbacteria bacterium RIFCSPHIGHO2_01_FULL_40_98]OGK27400.1 MAG: cell division protein FtsZ [Candidatus Roizmanbacteria bacterium RIFCSPHIGHO2_02_FULL_40_53]OGK30727.1 MAG: cell division protein FtsZ [Candidatus Roizmanbacteria bacterium RIFCSPHIGHO2_12_41_18]OGK36177.1 MAG: cell division protein FtsZ [Candidatus Roizmanbacteria bacterium RIFCSPHIGHO2_12_FULL_40_130]OGK50634.1 MAG: cell division protein FtsZ [Candidatus Roizmanbacteria bacteriu
MLVKPRAGQPAKIKVIGVGGGGGNAISSMINDGGIPGVEFVVVNTDAQALLHNKAETKIQIGENLTRGLGSGGDPDIGQQAAEESREKLQEELAGADMIFITCGEGGGTGTGSSPIIAEIAQETGALTVAVVTKPFEFEGAKRKVLSEQGTQNLQDKVDTLIIVPNQKILQVVDRKTSIIDAFKKIDSVLHQGVRGIAELITIPGLVNVDFADVKTIMKNAGTALMGIGVGSGDKRAMEAIRQAISSPLLDVSIEGSKGVLFNIVGGPDLSMSEVDEAASIIAKTVDPDADIIFGAVIDDKMVDQIRVTLIATKFDEGKLKMFRFRPDQKKEERLEQSDNIDEEKKIEDLNDLSQPSEVTEEELFDDDSEFDIPAFLRKK